MKKKAKPLREWWMWRGNMMSVRDETVLCEYEERAKEYVSFYGNGEIIHIREVPKKVRGK